MTEDALATFQLKSLSLIKSNFSVGDTTELEIPKETFILTANHSKIDQDIVVVLEINIELPEPKLKVNAAYQGVFTTSSESAEETSDFAKINAPAIIFPSIRYHVRHLTLEAGLPPLLLPLINFTKLKQEN
ncbi:MAG: protein-export chaperone SecB [Saprospiraceae bacterium]|nr:protein-export chaperone SecB [Candidatus Opimibacter iunctus]